jgi:hypothetical protein
MPLGAATALPGQFDKNVADYRHSIWEEFKPKQIKSYPNKLDREDRKENIFFAVQNTKNQSTPFIGILRIDTEISPQGRSSQGGTGAPSIRNPYLVLY